MGCKSVRNTRRKHCLADFRKFIKIIDSEIMPSGDGSYAVDNSDIITQLKASVKTRSPFAMINGVSIDTGITHRFVVRYMDSLVELLEKNSMILMDGDFYRVEAFTNENEDGLFLLIDASKRGKASIGANEA